MKRVFGAPAMRGRVGERADGRQELDKRAGPAVRHDQRQRVGVGHFPSMKWMSSPSRLVTNCGKAFSLASTLRQS
jgi:hypothetical protein